MSALQLCEHRTPILSGRRFAPVWLLAAIVVAATAFADRAAGQVILPDPPKQVEKKVYEPPWEYSPYRVHIWLVTDGARTLSPKTLDTVGDELLDEIDLAFGPAWRTSVSPAPTELAAAALASLDDLTVFDFDRLGRGWWFSGIDGIPVADFEKIYLVVLRDEGAEFDVAVREFEIPTYQTGPVRTDEAGSIRELAPVVRSLIAKSFTRLARVERAYETEESVETDDGPKIKRTQRAALRFRAAGLAGEGIEALVPSVGAPMTVAVRSNDRLGVPAPEGVAEMEFTYVLAERIEGSLVDGPVYSGLHSPLGGRSSRRLQRFVRWFPYAQGPTTLRIVSPATEANPSKPLGGYDIYARDPEGEESTFLGETDWRGEFAVPPGERPLRILYAKSGERLLARLPLAPGRYEEAIAIVPDDTFRLEAEGAVAAFQSRLTDLVARRQALAVRIRKKIEENQPAEAKRLLEDEFKPMFDRTGLTFELEELRKRFSTEDPALARRVETMFDTTRSILNKFLDAELDRQLEAQVKEAG